MVEDVLPRRFEDAHIDAASQSWQDRQLKVPILQNHRPGESQHHVLRSGLAVAFAIQPQIGNTVLSIETLAQIGFEEVGKDEDGRLPHDHLIVARRRYRALGHGHR
jgi:hypothetical protein